MKRYRRRVCGRSYSEKKFLIDELPKKLIINRNNIHQEFGKIIKNSVKFDKNFTSNLLPCSEFIEDSGRFNYDGIVIYWDIDKININNIIIFKKYLLLS